MVAQSINCRDVFRRLKLSAATANSSGIFQCMDRYASMAAPDGNLTLSLSSDRIYEIEGKILPETIIGPLPSLVNQLAFG